MKSRINIVIAVLVVVIGVLCWTIVKDRQSAGSILTVAPAIVAESTPVDAVMATPATAIPMAVAPVAAPIAVLPLTRQPAAMVEGASTYTAQPGDTVSNLAATLPGGNRKINRDAVIDANPSLQQNPDRVIAGKTYDIPTPGSAAAVREPVAVAVVPIAETPTVATPVVVAPAAPAAANSVASNSEVVHELKYTARAGDTVSTLAGALLGSDSKENRDAIIGANASLQNNPDRMVAEKNYQIPVRASQPLAAAPASEIKTAARPATQPDADSVVRDGSVRELRYVARAGDNVSTLAAALLGSDTKENRAAITDHNESLKRDPDRVVAGQTYWIPAPVAAAE